MTTTQIVTGVSPTDVRDTALHAIDIGLGVLEDEPDGDYTGETWALSLRSLQTFKQGELDFRFLHRVAERPAVNSFVADAVLYVERHLHPAERSCHHGKRRRSGECLMCDTVLPLFVKGLMNMFGVARASDGEGRFRPTRGLYCFPENARDRMMRRLSLSWPESQGTIADIELLPLTQRLDSWDLDPATKEVLREIEAEVLRSMSGRERRLARLIRLAARRVLRRRRRRNRQATALINLYDHPWTGPLLREGWIVICSPTYDAASMPPAPEPLGLRARSAQLAAPVVGILRAVWHLVWPGRSESRSSDALS